MEPKKMNAKTRKRLKNKEWVKQQRIRDRDAKWARQAERLKAVYAERARMP